jgi:hypothetical protein
VEVHSTALPVGIQFKAPQFLLQNSPVQFRPSVSEQPLRLQCGTPRDKQKFSKSHKESRLESAWKRRGLKGVDRRASARVVAEWVPLSEVERGRWGGAWHGIRAVTLTHTAVERGRQLPPRRTDNVVLLEYSCLRSTTYATEVRVHAVHRALECGDRVAVVPTVM